MIIVMDKILPILLDWVHLGLMNLPLASHLLRAVVYPLEQMIRTPALQLPSCVTLTSLCCSFVVYKVGLLLPILRISVKIK